MTDNTKSAELAERAKWEHWAEKVGLVAYRDDRYGLVFYDSGTKNASWFGWQARAALDQGASSAMDGWIGVDERLPMKYCLAVYTTSRGRQHIIRAMHVKQFEIEACGDECDSETNDADELEYIKAGWYECVDNWGDYSSVSVGEGVVTHWQPLPSLPGKQAAPEAPAAASVKTWQERLPLCPTNDERWACIEAENADLRAALAQQSTKEASHG